MNSKIEIIPAIDIIEGKCVRLSQGDYSSKTIYNENPLDAAKEFEYHGITRLHLVDLDGAKAGRIINYKVLEKIASKTQLTIDFGGGLKSNYDLKIAFESGAAMVTGGSIAVKDPKQFTEWLHQYGADKIILGADAKDGHIAITGWTESTTDELIPFIKKYIDEGVKKVICTDISRDGMLQGPATELYRNILDAVPGTHLIASGGISGINDIQSLIINNIPAVIIGKAIYEGKIKLTELKRFLI